MNGGDLDKWSYYRVTTINRFYCESIIWTVHDQIFIPFSVDSCLGVPQRLP